MKPKRMPWDYPDPLKEETPLSKPIGNLLFELIVFKHDSELGNASAHKLFDLVTVNRSGDGSAPPRSFGDYEVTIDKGNVPAGVMVNEMI